MTTFKREEREENRNDAKAVYLHKESSCWWLLRLLVRFGVCLWQIDENAAKKLVT